MKKEGEAIKALLDGYVKNNIMLYDKIIDDEKDLYALDTMTRMLRDIKYTIDAIYFDDTPLKELNYKEVPDDVRVYLFDTKRSMFWKGSYGYTFTVHEAQTWDLKTAQEKVRNDFRKETKMIYFNY